jgi:hypothetical protein
MESRLDCLVVEKMSILALGLQKPFREWPGGFDRRVEGGGDGGMAYLIAGGLGPLGERPLPG